MLLLLKAKHSWRVTWPSFTLGCAPLMYGIKSATQERGGARNSGKYAPTPDAFT